jgi:hypothetical protein
VAWYISPLSLSVGDACQRSGGFGVVDPCVRFGARVARSELSEWLLGYYFLDRDINQIEFHIHYFFFNVHVDVLGVSCLLPRDSRDFARISLRSRLRHVVAVARG